MTTLKGSQTEKNLLIAFSGESQARNRYTYFASAAKKEGFEQISYVFTVTAEQEKEHAKRLFKQLQGGEVEITASFPAGIISSTLENLKEAAAGEKYEYEVMYPNFAEVAKAEGFNEIAGIMTSIAIAEKAHEKRYLEFAGNIMQEKVFKKDAKVVWQCRNCGYTTTSVEAPHKCPACDHSQSYFELIAQNW
ncbi:MAG: Rubrerythrin [Alphaproteobacteria bacterium ADurb.Bin438]|nr:MAG: Rubrerythrin [Alphaproteobacteria bacterium ADurb.Bin438]